MQAISIDAAYSIGVAVGKGRLVGRVYKRFRIIPDYPFIASSAHPAFREPSTGVSSSLYSKGLVVSSFALHNIT